jgi:prepilin-type N-terminal cleavage/methylation domain-containing protein
MKFLKKLNSQSGFTIVELVAAMAVLTLVSAGVVSFTVSKTIQTARDSTRADLLNNAQIGLDHMANDIRLSSKADDANRWADVNGPTSGNSYSWQSTSSTLILATSAKDGSGNILFDDKADYITTKNNFVYFLKSGTLYKRVLAATVSGNSAKTSCPVASATASCPADKIILTNISSLSVQYYDTLNQQVDPANARSIQLNVQLKQTTFGQQIKANYSTRMVFRNG